MCILSTRYSRLASRIALVLNHSASVLLYNIVNRPSLFLFALENPEVVSQKSSHAPLSLSLSRFPLVFAYQTSNARLERLSYHPCPILTVKLPPLCSDLFPL